MRISSIDLFLSRDRASACGAAGALEAAGVATAGPGAFAPNKVEDAAGAGAAAEAPNRPPATPVAAVGAALLVAGVAVDEAAALDAVGAELCEPSAPNRPPDGAAVDAGGLAPKSDGVVVDVAAGAADAAGFPRVNDGAAAGVALVVVIVGVALVPLNSDDWAGLACSAGLLKLNRPPDAGCAGVAEEVGAAEAGVAAAGVLAAGPPKSEDPPPAAAGVAGFAPKRLEEPADCVAPPKRAELDPDAGAGAAGVVDPNKGFDAACPLVAPPNRLDDVAGALDVGGVAAGVVDPWLLKLNSEVFAGAGVVDGAEDVCAAVPPNRLDPPVAGAVAPPPKSPVDALEAGVCVLGVGALFSPCFCPNRPPPFAGVLPPPPNKPPPPPPPDVAVLPKENPGLLVPLEPPVALPKSPPLGVLPVEAPNGLAVEAAGLLPNKGVDDWG